MIYNVFVPHTKYLFVYGKGLINFYRAILYSLKI